MCNYLTKDRFSLVNHMKSVHNKIKNIKCDKCSYTISPDCDSINHTQLVHKKAKNVQSESCILPSVVNSGLNLHIKKVHQKTKAFQRNQCSSFINAEHGLNMHTKNVHQTTNTSQKQVNNVHPKIKNFSCKTCNYKASNHIEFNRHVTLVHTATQISKFKNKQHKIATYKCKQCSDMVFDTPWKLKRHLRNVHKPAVKNKKRRNKSTKHKKKLKNHMSLVYNFSDVELTEQATSLLNKGLKFCPNPKGINKTQLLADMARLERSMAWHTIFGNRNDDKPNGNDIDSKTEDIIFKREKKTNLPKYYPKEISQYVESVTSDFVGTEFIKVHPNLTKTEQEALINLLQLQKEGKIVMQPADKNLGIVIFNREDYVNEGLRQLNECTTIDGSNVQYYKKVDANLLTTQHRLIKKCIEDNVQKGLISNKTAKQLIPTKIQAGNLYLLAKVHKKYIKIPKGRPIVSGKDSITERISWFCDMSAKNYVPRISSYVQDTSDLLRFFEELNDSKRLPNTAKPFSIDIKSMYTNIPIEEGILAFQELLNSRNDTEKAKFPTDFVVELLTLVLKSNIFEFNNELWIQILGTAMGTRVAPTFANIFMAKLEKLMQDSCPSHIRKHIFAWKRYIDDILIIFTGSYEEFDDLMRHLNSVHKTIKFEEPNHDRQENACNFLDIKVAIKESSSRCNLDALNNHINTVHVHSKLNSIRCTEFPSIVIENEHHQHVNSNTKIVTDLYRKETEKPRALLPSSCHPAHITKNTIYGLAFRLLRICSSESSFKYRLQELKKEYLIPRGYKDAIIEQQFAKVTNIEGQDYEHKRKAALIRKEKSGNTDDRVIAVLDYNPHLPNANHILTKHHRSMIDKNNEIKEDFNLPPMVAFRQPLNLRRILCKSKLPVIVKRVQRHENSGWRPCGNNCPICPFTLPKTSILHGQASNYKHEITDKLSCDSERCIYYWKCDKRNCKEYPRCEYIGKTKRTFKTRLSEHRDYIKSCNTSEVAGEHFTKAGHSVANFKCLAIESVRSKDPFVLNARETLLIKKFDTFKNGLNRER